MRGVWKDRKKQKEHCRRASKLGIQKIKENIKKNPDIYKNPKDGRSVRCKKLTREQQSKFGKLCRIYENEIANKIKSEYDKLYYPSSVCDRIGVKDGKIFFIEIKQKGRRLSQKQQEFQKIAKNQFILLQPTLLSQENQERDLSQDKL